MLYLVEALVNALQRFRNSRLARKKPRHLARLIVLIQREDILNMFRVPCLCRLTLRDRANGRNRVDLGPEPKVDEKDINVPPQGGGVVCACVEHPTDNIPST